MPMRRQRLRGSSAALRFAGADDVAARNCSTHLSRAERCKHLLGNNFLATVQVPLSVVRRLAKVAIDDGRPGPRSR